MYNTLAVRLAFKPLLGNSKFRGIEAERTYTWVEGIFTQLFALGRTSESKRNTV